MTIVQRTKRDVRKYYRENLNPWLDEAGAVGSVAGAHYLGDTYRKFFKQVRSEYISNVTKATKRKGFVAKQMSFKGIKRKDSIEPFLSKEQAKIIKKRIYKNFSEPQKTKFGFFPTSRKWIRAIRSPYRVKTQDLPIPSHAKSALKKLNRRSVFRVLKKSSPKALVLLGVTFGSIPLSKAIQAKYSEKRKFKKEFKKGVQRGIINPYIGYSKGANLDKLLAKHPYLRASKTIRAKEGRYAQQYGQGVQFWKGTSGMKSEDLKKLDRDTARLLEQRRLAKRRRGK